MAEHDIDELFLGEGVLDERDVGAGEGVEADDGPAEGLKIAVAWAGLGFVRKWGA